MCNHYVFTGSLKSLSFHQNPLLPAQQTHRLKKVNLNLTTDDLQGKTAWWFGRSFITVVIHDDWMWILIEEEMQWSKQFIYQF